MARKKIVSVASYNDSAYEQFAENITRVRYVKYFKGTKPAFKERESTGILMGGFLSLIIGCIGAPYLLTIGSHFSSRTITGFTMLMAATTIFLAIWGFRKILEEKKRIYKPVKDEEYDKYFAFDLKGLAVRARMLVTDKTPILKDGKDSIEGIDPIILYSPEGYSSNVNLPLLIKQGDDGFIRASNLYVMILFPTKQGMYINITYLNLCDGSAKFDRIYACPYEDVERVFFAKREYSLVSQQGRNEMKRVKSFMITSGSGDTKEIGVDVVDYDIIDQYGGKFDVSATEKAVELLNAKIRKALEVKNH